MKKISLWAKNHPWSARFIIIFSFGLLNIAAIITGILLDELAVTLPPAMLTAVVAVYFISILFYPHKHEKRKLTPALFYIQQKTCDAILAAAAFFIMVCISNDRFRSLQYFPSLHAATTSKPLPPIDSTVKKYKSIAAFSASLKDENGNQLKWKERKKLLKEQVRAIKKSKDISEGGKVALIILSVIVALGLIALVTALACELSCNGSDTAAAIIGIGGTALIVFLLVIAIRAITGRKRKKAIIKEQVGKTD